MFSLYRRIKDLERRLGRLEKEQTTLICTDYREMYGYRRVSVASVVEALLVKLGLRITWERGKPAAVNLVDDIKD